MAFDLGQWAALPYSIRDDDSIKRTLEGADIVINLIGAFPYIFTFKLIIES